MLAGGGADAGAGHCVHFYFYSFVSPRVSPHRKNHDKPPACDHVTPSFSPFVWLFGIVSKRWGPFLSCAGEKAPSIRYN